MPGRAKKFISKKNAVTYRLVPRCQLDPDGDSSEHVLVPVDQVKHEKFNIKLPESALPPSTKEISDLKKQIPLKGPQPDWDPDIVAALDGGLGHEDEEAELEDDFIALANGPAGESQASNKFKNDSENGDRDDGPLFSDDDDGSLFSFDNDDDEKPNFTQYSLTSAVTNCTEDMQILNERFEKFYTDYADDKIGSLEHEEIEGCYSPNSEIIKSLSADCLEDKKRLSAYNNDVENDLKHKTVQLYEEVSSGDENLTEEEVTEEQLPQYDCESIISTYSNKHNHPMLIKAEKEEKAAKIPVNAWKQTLTRSNLRQLDREVAVKEEDVDSVISKNESTINSFNIRPKNETQDARRLRKQGIKQAQRENRIFKKENKLAFKEEKKRGTSVALNANRNKFVHL